MNDIERLFTELKKMVEQQKIAEEQERLRRLQVSDQSCLICRNKSAIILQVLPLLLYTLAPAGMYNGGTCLWEEQKWLSIYVLSEQATYRRVAFIVKHSLTINVRIVEWIGGNGKIIEQKE